MNDSTTTSSSAAKSDAKNDKSAQKDLYRLNPAPKEGYEVTLTIENAPGQFKQVSWSAMYQAKGCSYVVNDFAGVRGEPEKVIELPFKEQADGNYVATVYLDAMLDEDYYGNGVCKWSLTSVGVSGAPSGAAEEASFGGRTDMDSIRSGAPMALYYLKSRYGALAPKPSDEHEQISKAVFGQSDRQIFGADQQDDLFSFVLTAKSLQP